MQASREEVSFIPVPPKSIDQTWRTLEPPNYLEDYSRLCKAEQQEQYHGRASAFQITVLK